MGIGIWFVLVRLWKRNRRRLEQFRDGRAFCQCDGAAVAAFVADAARIIAERFEYRGVDIGGGGGALFGICADGV